MITFGINFTIDEVRQAVVSWSELLAMDRYADALDMFLHTSESFGEDWTPEMLEDYVTNYGVPRADYDDGTYHRITSLYEQPDPESYIRNAIKVERRTFERRDAERYIGWVHYDDVPLDGHRSDLTARFFIVKTGPDQVTLEFLDIHVM